MCGLFGFSGRQPVDLTKLRWLAVENQSRGSHSAGVYTIKQNKEKTRTLFKDIGSSISLVDDIGWRDAVKGALTVQGHTRAATVGSVTKENAHPFSYDYTGQENGTLCIGAHNGFVLDNFKGEEQWKKFGFDKAFAVDSQLIFATLAKTGDYNMLPQIEGGIACSFQMPNKYGDALFLYQASGRELHFGLTPEGVYYSSERDPLRLIDAKAITNLPYHTMVVLQGGMVLDILPMPKPNIILRQNAKRDSWNDSTSLTVDELREFGFKELAEKASKTHYGSYNSYPAKKTEDQASNLPSSIGTKIGGKGGENGQTEYQDKLQLLISDVKSLIDGLIPEPASFMASSSYSNQDTSSCLFLLQLKSSTKQKQALAGWLVYDQAEPAIGGITALNGVTVMKFPEAQCGKKHTLVISCPVEDKFKSTLFSIDIDPEKARVMEVTLELPFPSQDRNEPSSDENKVEVNNVPFKVTVGGPPLLICSTGSKQRSSILSPAGEVSKELSDEQVCARPEEQQTVQQQEHSSRNSGDGGGSEGVHQGEHIRPGSGLGSHVGKSFLMLPVGNVATIVSILNDENKTFHYKDKVKRVLLSQEYSYAITTWARKFKEVRLDLRRLFHDAAVLKLRDLELFQNSYALSYYAWRLATHLSDNYLISKLTEETNREYFRVLGELARENREMKADVPEVARGKKSELVRIDLLS